MDTTTDEVTKEPEIVKKVNDLIQESDQGRQAFIEQACLNDTMYLGHIPSNEAPRVGLSYILINKTGQAIITRTQVQVESQPRIEVIARQSSREPEYWMSRRALATIRSLIDRNIIIGFDPQEPVLDELELPDDDLEPMEDAAQVVAPDETEIEVEDDGFPFGILDDSNATSFRVSKGFYERVAPLLGQWQTKDGVIAAPVLNEKDIVLVDDEITARVNQNNLNITWQRTDMDLLLRNNIVNTLKFGVQGWLFVMDKDTRKSRVIEIHLMNLFLPPNCTGIHDAEYVIVREIISTREAKVRFPQAKKQIEEYAQRNTSGLSTSSSLVSGDMPYSNVSFGRNMIEVWHTWWRNEKYPMTTQEAIDNGRVVEDDGKYYLTDDEFNVTDEQVEEGKGAWPKRLGIRYLQMIGNSIVGDEECAHFDIPVVLNQNIPVSYSPWSQGEPERLWFAQKLIDKMSSIILDHITYFRSPQQILPISVYKKLKGLDMVYSRPDRDAFIDDTTFERYRDFFQSGRGFYVDPPTMSAQYVELWQLAMRLHDELSGNAGVLQGRAPGANASGKLVRDLQSAARGVIGFNSSQTEAFLRKWAKLEMEAWAKWVPLIVWSKANEDIPVEVLDAVRARSRETDFNVIVEISSGGGELRSQLKFQAMQEVAQQLRSPQSYRRMAEITDDPEWDDMAAQGQQQLAQAPPAQPSDANIDFSANQQADTPI